MVVPVGHLVVEVPYSSRGGPVQKLQKDSLPCLLPDGQDLPSHNVSSLGGSVSCPRAIKRADSPSSATIWHFHGYRTAPPRLPIRHLHVYRVQLFEMWKLQKKIFVKGQPFLFTTIHIVRATASVLTSGKEKKYVFSPSNLSLAVRGSKLGICTLYNTTDVLQKLAPAGC